MLGDYVDNTDEQTDTLYRLVDGYYTTTDNGPLVVLTVRSENHEKDHLYVEGFEPYCYIRRGDLTTETVDRLRSEPRVKRLTDAERRGVETLGVDERGADDLVKIVTHNPWHVRELRTSLRKMGIEPYEADVRFIQRFCIDKGINTYLTVTGDTDGYVDHTDVCGTDDEAVSPIPPRVCVYDIEVLMGDGTSVVTKGGTEQAQQPITAIAAHDSYTDTYHLWSLLPNQYSGNEQIAVDTHEQFGERTGEDRTVSLYHDETEMLESFVTWVARFDVLSGWNSSGFDTPYLCNRCNEVEAWSIYDLCPTDDFSLPSGDGQWINSDVRGIHCLDAQDAFLKTEYATPKSKTLEHFAQKVLGVGKLDYDGDLDSLYFENPTTYFTYNLIDTKRTVDLVRERNVF